MANIFGDSPDPAPTAAAPNQFGDVPDQAPAVNQFGDAPDPTGAGGGASLAKQATDYFSSYAQPQENPVYQAVKEAVQPEKPIGEISPEDEAKLKTYSPGMQKVLRGAAIPLDLGSRAMSALTTFGVEEFKSILKSGGVSEQTAERLGQDALTYVAGESGRVPEVATPRDTSITGLMGTYRGKGFDPNLVRRPGPIERGLPEPGAPPTEPTPTPPAPAPVTPSPFPNAATDNLPPMGNVDFAPEPAAAPPTVPSARDTAQTSFPVPAPGEAPVSIGGPYKPPAPGTVFPEKDDTALKAAEQAIAETTVPKPGEAKAKFDKNAAQFYGEKLRQGLEDIKAKKAGASEAEKFALAQEEQKIKQQQAKLEAEKPKPKFTVIEGGKPPDVLSQRLPPPDIPPLPPTDAMSPPPVGLSADAITTTEPHFPITAGLQATFGAAPVPDFTYHHATVPKGAEILEFGTPADVEGQLVKVGQSQNVVVRAKKSDFAPSDISARWEDLPTGHSEGERVTGGMNSRQYLRAAIDGKKQHDIYMMAGMVQEAAQIKGPAFASYLEFLRDGGRVLPGHGDRYLLLNASKYIKQLETGASVRQPRTTRTIAVLSDMRLGAKAYSVFSMEKTSQVRGTALDIAKLSSSSAVSALPWQVTQVLRTRKITTTEATEQQFRDAGVYFVQPENNALWEDTRRLFTLTDIYGENWPGWYTDYVNLMRRGLRVSVVRSSPGFVVSNSELERAAIPGVNLPPRGDVYLPGTYSEKIKRDTLSVKADFLPTVPIIRRDKQIIRRYAMLAKVALRKMGIKLDLTITPVGYGGLPQGTGEWPSNRFGMMRVDPDGAMKIYLHVPNHYNRETGTLDDLMLMSTMAHEFGHMLVEATWPHLPFEIQDQLMIGADLERLRLGTATQRQIMMASGSVFELNGSLPFPMDRDSAQYFGGMHEFLARQVERYILGEVTAVSGKARAYVGSLANRMQKFWGAARKANPRFFAPKEAALDWMNYLKNNPITETRLGEATNEKMEQSMEPSGRLALPGVEHPTSGVTVNAGVAFDRIFPKGPGKDFDGNALLKGANWFTHLIRKSLSIDNLAKSNAHIPGAQGHVAVMDQWNNYALQQFALRYGPRQAAWHKLGATDGDRLSKLLFHIAEMKYLSPFEMASGVQRHPTRAEFAESVRRFGLEGNANALQVYNDITGDFKDALQRLVNELKLKATINLEPAARQAELDAIDAFHAGLSAKPYFPFTRFGQYAIDVTDKGTGKRVAFFTFESAKQRDAAGAAVRKKYQRPLYEVQADMTIDDELRPFIGMPSLMLQRIRERLDFTSSADRIAMGKEFDALTYEMGPANSFRRQLVDHEGIEGFSRDAMRVYANYMISFNRHLGRIIYQEQAAREIDRMFAYAKQLRNKDRTISLARYFRANLEQHMNPANDHLWLRSAVFSMMLLGVPKSAFNNLFQIPLVGLPHLMSIYGYAGAVGHVATAFGHAAKNWNQILGNPHFKEDPMMFQARQKGYAEGVLRDGIAADLANVATASPFRRYNAPNIVMRKAYNIVDMGGSMFSWGDSIGRHTVFEAARRLAIKGYGSKHVDKLMASDLYQRTAKELEAAGWTEENIRGYIAAKDAVITSYGLPGRWNKPAILRGKAGIYTSLLAYERLALHFQFADFNKGGALSLLVLALFAGYMGEPGAEDINNLLKQIVGLAGYDFDIEKELRSWLKTMFGKDSHMPDYLEHGLSSHSFGLADLFHGIGWPAPDFDDSGSLGEGRVIPGLSQIDLRSRTLSTAFNDLTGSAATSMSGAAVGFAAQMIRAALNIPYHYDDMKSYEPLMPNAIKNPMKAARMAEEERERNRKGATVVPWDMNNWNDRLTLAFAAMGFVPSKLAAEYNTQRSLIEANNFWKAQRAILSESYYQALDSHDKIAINEAYKNITTFNIRVTNLGIGHSYTLNNKQLMMNYHQRLKAIQEQTSGVGPRGQRDLTKQIRGIYEEKIIDRKETR